MKTPRQLEEWIGEFGNEYISRNNFTNDKLNAGKIAFERMLKKTESVNSIFEVGANIGLNEYYLSHLLGDSVSLNVIEPNDSAFKELTNGKYFKLDQAWNHSGFDMPCADTAFDLVFTSRVLIHIAPQDLLKITSEIVRVSSKYVLCCEYFNDTPVTIDYRGKASLLFKRDFGKYYLSNFPCLKCIDYGFLWKEELFPAKDNINWWLFEKVDT